MKILIFPRYSDTQASTRVRFLQFEKYLKNANIEFEYFFIISDGGISNNKNKILFLFFKRMYGCLKVLKKLFLTRNQKIIIHMHYELFPFIPFFFEIFLIRLFKRKFIIELDDAWFHRYNDNKILFVRIILGRKIDNLMKYSSLVIAGNKYIGNYAANAGAKKVLLLPTVVNLTDYNFYNSIAPARKEKSDLPIIGWIGAPATTKFLLLIADVIIYISERKIGRFVAIGADKNMIKHLPVVVLPWSKETELFDLKTFDIGIMPLSNSLFANGKCGFKLIQYMAMKIPVIASPVGVNNDIVENKHNGFLSTTPTEWIKSIEELCSNHVLRTYMGNNGYKTVMDNYTTDKIAPALIDTYRNLI